MKFILRAKVLFCGNWQNIFSVFFGWKSEKDFSPWDLKFFIKLIFRRNKLHTSRIMSIFVCEELKMTDYA